jgi:hypothetical protein
MHANAKVTKFCLQIALVALLIVSVAQFFLVLRHIWFEVDLSEISCEYREGSILANTQLMTEGKNPISFAYQPMYYDTYGLLFNLVVYPFAKIFGPTFLVHRVPALLFGLGASVVLAMALIFASSEISLTALAFGICIMARYLFQIKNSLAFCGRPDSLALLLFLLSIWVPFQRNYTEKSKFIGLGLAILASLTKLYFGLGVVILVIDELYRNRTWRGLRFIFIAGLSLIFVYGGMLLFVPEYFGETVWIWLGYYPKNLTFLADQTVVLVDRVWPELALGGIVLTGLFFLDKNHQNRKPNYASLSIWALALIFNFLIWVLWMGQHNGSRLEYFLQLILPFVLILSFRNLVRLPQGAQLGAVLLCLLPMTLGCLDLVKVNDNKDPRFEQLAELIRVHHKIWTPPPYVPILLQEHKEIFNGGQTEYFALGGSSRIVTMLSDINERVLQVRSEYEKKMNFMIERKAFDLVLEDGSLPSFWNEKVFEEKYELKQSFSSMYNGGPLNIWLPKKN